MTNSDRWCRAIKNVRWHGVTCIALACLQAVLISALAFRYGPTPDEPGHLAGGVAVILLGRVDLYSVNPPLVKSIAALPWIVSGVETDWTTWRPWDASDRTEFSAGTHLLLANRAWPRLLVFARLAVLPFVLIGGVACFLWARDLAGPSAGAVAQVLWTFCPNILGNGALVTPDAAAASLGVVAGYAFWRWSERPSWPRAFSTGLALGLALLTKFTWLILPPLWIGLWLLRRVFWPRDEARPSLRVEAAQLGIAFVVGLVVIHAGYGFDRPLWRLGEPTFVSVALAGEDSPANGGEGGNRFRDTRLGSLPVPLPQMLVSGCDLQKLDFDKGSWSYMRGKLRLVGWHDFYLYAALVKLPLGTLALIALACVAALLGSVQGLSAARPRTFWVSWITVVAPGLAVLVLVSGETGFTRFFRYALPALPFAFVWAGRAASLATNLPGKALVGGCLAATAGSSLAVWPHSLAYFNEVAGGPSNGWKHLTDANLDWGQDLPRLAEWQREYPEAKPLYLATYEQLVPEIYGLEYEQVPMWPTPGWYAVGLTELYRPESRVKWLRDHDPIDQIGYTMRIYYIDGDTSRVERGG